MTATAAKIVCTMSLETKKKKQQPIVKLKVQGVQVPFLVDTGATVNILTKDDFDNVRTMTKERITLQNTKTSVYAFGSKEPSAITRKD